MAEIYESVKASGEAAIKLWLDGSITEAFEPLSTGAELLLNSKSDNHEWKSLAVIYGHLCAYLSSVAVTGKPAEVTLDPEVYVEPAPGLLLNYRTDLFNFYRDSLDLFILLQLVLFAEAINQDEDATSLALTIYENNKDSFNLIKTGNNLISHLIVSGKYEMALILSFKSNLYLFSMQVTENSDINPRPARPESEADLQKILNSQPEALRHEIDKSSMIFSLIPVLLGLANTMLLEPELAEKQAEEVYSACLEVAKEAYLPELWESAAAIIKGVFNGKYTFQELLDMGDKYSGENNFILKHICLLGGTLQKDIIPENAIVTHIVVFNEIIRNFVSAPFLYRNTAIPFFKNYWQAKFSNNRFRFKSPLYVQGQLEETSTLPPDKIIKKILYIIVTSLNIRLDQSYLNTLKTDCIILPINWTSS